MTSLFSNHSFHKSKFALKCDCRPKNGPESHRNKRKGQIRLVGRCGSLWVVPGFSNYGSFAIISTVTCQSTMQQRESKFPYFHFANYRFSFRKLQILISQTTDSHFANYRFPFHFVPFRFVPFRFANYSKPGLLAKPLKKFPKSPIRRASSHF